MSAYKTPSANAAYNLDKAGVGVGYMQEDKEFLAVVFDRYPKIRDAFLDCAKILPGNRQHEVRLKMAGYERRIWEDCGIPEGSRQTLAQQVGQMAMLANLYPQKNYDYAKTMEKIGLWGLPRAVADEIPYDEMLPSQRRELHKLAARMIFNDHTARHAFDTWESLETPVAIRKPFNPAPDESEWVRDLDYMASALKARDYQRQYPHKAQTLENLVEDCRRAIVTDEARDLWRNAIGAAPDLRPIEIVIEREKPALTISIDSKLSPLGGASAEPSPLHA